MLNACLTASFAQTAYFVDNGGVRTFYYDNKINIREGSVHFLSEAASTASSVESVIFDASFANYQIDDSNVWNVRMSHYNRNLKSVEGLENLNTKNVTNMSRMFYGCSGLTSIDVSNFDTQNVTYMSGMFSGCSGLTSIDVSNFDTKNVTNMLGMFNGCSAVTSLDLSKFDTQNVKDMGNMFGQCTGLQYSNVAGITTSPERELTMPRISAWWS